MSNLAQIFYLAPPQPSPKIDLFILHGATGSTRRKKKNAVEQYESVKAESENKSGI